MSLTKGNSLLGKSLANLFEDKSVPDDYLYSVEVGDEKKPGEGKPRRYAKMGNDLALHPNGVGNLHENLLNGAKISTGKPFLGKRIIRDGVAGEFVWETYDQVLTRIKNIGVALSLRGYKPDTNIGLFSINNPEWVIAEHACYMYGLVTVPLYDTLGSEAVEYIITSTDTPVIFATSDKVKLLLDWIKKLPSLKLIVIMDQKGDDLMKRGNEAGVTVISLANLEKEGEGKTSPPPKVTGDTVATLCYTSGTTGLPKGVILSHSNILSFAAGYILFAKNGECETFSSADVHLSYLPLAHIFERIVQALLVNVGAQIGFFQGDTLKLLEDVAELKPTLFISVPRLYNRIYDKITAGVKEKGGLAAYLFNRAYAVKKEYLARGYQHHTFWDALVFGKVKQRLGGRVRFMASGAAPISPDVVDFMRICFGATFHEGYGQTETTGAACITVKSDLTTGHVGVPFPSCLIKLRDVPSMNYTSEDTPYPRGEIMIKGNNCFSGYYKAADKTAETIIDGWVATGDVGMWDNHGRLKIIDRVKNIFKLAQGEYIAPEKIEIVYNKHELIAQSFVYGDSLQPVLVAVIVPDWDVVQKWATTKGYNSNSLKEFCEDAGAKKEILSILSKYGKENDLKGFECVKAIHLSSELFTPDNGLLSPTFKLKRHEAKKLYLKEIDAMYASLNK